MFQNLKLLASSNGGSIAIVFAMSLPFVVAMAGLGVDVGDWYMQKRDLQTAADAASMAGAYELANQQSQARATSAAQTRAADNGYDSSGTGNTLGVVYGTQGGNPTVQVNIHAQVRTSFVQLMDKNPVYADVTATTLVNGTSGPYCFLALDTNAADAVTTAGNATVDAASCGVADNSSNSAALYLNGSAFMDVGAVKIVGNYQITGGAATFDYSSLRTAASTTADPYAGLSISSFASCTKSQQKSGPTKITGGGNVTLSPGVYCGGISMSGNNNVTLSPGTYVMDGGDFGATGGGSITGNGVTIILTISGGGSYGTYGALSVSGGRNILLSAPTSGNYAGLVMYQDRNAPSGTPNTLTGTAGLTLNGAMYAPSNGIKFGGNGGVANFNGTPCTKIIADTITFQGNPQLGNNCSSAGAASIGSPGVTLIL